MISRETRRVCSANSTRFFIGRIVRETGSCVTTPDHPRSGRPAILCVIETRSVSEENPLSALAHTSGYDGPVNRADSEARSALPWVATESKQRDHPYKGIAVKEFRPAQSRRMW